jgi:serine/threonine protein kinase
VPDFGSRWKVVDKARIGAGGQGNTFLVTDTTDTSNVQFVAKVLKGADLTKDSPRWKRLEEEIEALRTCDHPNIVKVIDSGYTRGTKYPFFVMPLLSPGSLQNNTSLFDTPFSKLTAFLQICEGVGHMHQRKIIHRDIKPANILINERTPYVGDLGLCFRFSSESLTEPMEVATARWYGAPELQNGHCENPQPSADVYSLGKLLYWLFTEKVYAREEQDYGFRDRKLVRIFDAGENPHRDARLIHVGAFIDELVEQTVHYIPSERIQNATLLASEVSTVINRIQAGGRALDLNLPQPCMFCAKGQYEAIAQLPPVDKRPAPNADEGAFAIYDQMRGQGNRVFGQAPNAIRVVPPMYLLCNHCGHVAQFRFPPGKDSVITRWRP